MGGQESPVAIVGAGPTGIACAIELARLGVAAVCYEKGFLLDSLYHFPEEMVWYSTRDLLDIAGVPFASVHAHPTRLESLAYYRAVAEKFRVAVEPETEVVSTLPAAGGGLRISARRKGDDFDFRAPFVILATGFFHNPLRLGVPGEDLPLVHRRFVSSYPFHDRDVVIVGGRNSAAEAALDLYRHGARVTMLVRGAGLSDRVKYWIRPDLVNRIQAGAVRAVFGARVLEVRPDSVRAATSRGEENFPTQAVFPLIGYEPDFGLMERCGVRLVGPERTPEHDPKTLESNAPGIFLAGAVLSGTETGRIFIENSRHHAGLIAAAIARRLRTLDA
jgi:thioredoxin reductase (NADPH)